MPMSGSVLPHQPAASATVPLPATASWLIFADRGGVGEQLAEKLRAAGADCTLVHAGAAFARKSDDHYEIHPRRGEDMAELL